MRIVLLGPQGSGKAELAQKISNEYKIPVITQHSVVDTAAAVQGTHAIYYMLYLNIYYIY